MVKKIMENEKHHPLKIWMEKNNIKLNQFSKKVKLSSPHLSCFRSYHKTPSLFNALKIWYACNQAFPLEQLLSPTKLQQMQTFKKELNSHE